MDKSFQERRREKERGDSFSSIFSALSARSFPPGAGKEPEIEEEKKIDGEEFFYPFLHKKRKTSAGKHREMGLDKETEINSLRLLLTI